MTLDTSFREVMTRCAEPRPQYPGDGTWITPAMIEAYSTLHTLGHAHSIESWLDGQLAGGLYGIAIGGAFFGESMFSRADNASKVAVVTLVRQLRAWGFTLFDCQQYSPHMMRLGAEEIPRADFVKQLASAIALADRRGRWVLDQGPE